MLINGICLTIDSDDPGTGKVGPADVYKAAFILHIIQLQPVGSSLGHVAIINNAKNSRS